jgi:hypothetical protein
MIDSDQDYDQVNNDDNDDGDVSEDEAVNEEREWLSE